MAYCRRAESHSYPLRPPRAEVVAFRKVCDTCRRMYHIGQFPRIARRARSTTCRACEPSQIALGLAVADAIAQALTTPPPGEPP